MIESRNLTILVYDDERRRAYWTSDHAPCDATSNHNLICECLVNLYDSLTQRVGIAVAPIGRSHLPEFF